MRKAISAIVVAGFSLGLVSQSFGTAEPAKKTQIKPVSVRTISSEKTPADLSLVHRTTSSKITKAKNTITPVHHKAKLSHSGKNKSKLSSRHINKTNHVLKSSSTNEKSGSRV